MRPDRVGMALLVFGFTIGRWEPHATALPCTTTYLPGGSGLLRHGDGGCGLVSGGSRGRAGMGTQDLDEGPIGVVNFGRLRGDKGTAVVAY